MQFCFARQPTVSGISIYHCIHDTPFSSEFIFDDFIISKIREITVRFEPRIEQNKSENSPSPARAEMATIDLALDPKIKILNIREVRGLILSPLIESLVLQDHLK